MQLKICVFFAKEKSLNRDSSLIMSRCFWFFHSLIGFRNASLILAQEVKLLIPINFKQLDEQTRRRIKVSRSR
jgi:hypothetical protein